jgi:hypothetical protein
MASLLLLMGSFSTVVCALDGPLGRRGGMGLPPEAIEACKEKSEGTSVEIATPRGDKLKATCKQMDGQLVAVPEGSFKGPKRNPSDDIKSAQ